MVVRVIAIESNMHYLLANYEKYWSIIIIFFSMVFATDLNSAEVPIDQTNLLCNSQCYDADM